MPRWAHDHRRLTKVHGAEQCVICERPIDSECPHVNLTARERRRMKAREEKKRGRG